MSDNLTFGLTMLIVGMGGTLATLFLLTIIIRALVAFFPVRSADEEEKK
jgi:Na+-transporting methylmalonyl-CoA/oxaloacetate decarboxylase gamma subunit